jgi:aerobic-type carbon monoxide dehydrogenase small subunit (CoxS/CutS family)
MNEVEVTLRVNGGDRTGACEPRTTLADFLRGHLGLTGTHLGCEHGVCGACTVLVDGATARSCLMLAVQAQGHAVTTIEGLGTPEHPHPLMRAFSEMHGLQCGFCTPGFILSADEYLRENPQPDREAMRRDLSGNICRCTGYVKIFESITRAAELMAEPEATRS